MDHQEPHRPVKAHEIGNMRHNVNLIKTQISAGRVDGQFLVKQMDTLAELLERLEAEEKQRKAAQRFEALYNISRVLGASLDLQTVLNQVMDAIIQLTGAERGFLMLRDDDGGLRVKAARNLDQQTLGSDKFKYSRTVSHQVLDTGQPIQTTNASEDPRFSGQASIVSQALRSIMATPLRARGQVIGVAYVDSQAMAGLFDNDDLAALDALSGQAAIAIENAKLFETTDQALSERVEQLQQLRRIDLLLNQTLDADEAMKITLEWACRLSGATSGHLGLIEGDTLRVRTLHHYPPESADDEADFLDSSYSWVWQVIKTGRTMPIPPGEESPDSLLIVPIRREQQVIGIVVLKCTDGDLFSEEQQDLVERVISRAAVSIENARLYAAVQEADKAKSEFVGIVAHDLKSPMTSIAGYSDLIAMDGNLIERQIDFLKRIKDTVKRMEMLVSDLADISRIEGGQFYMDERRVSVMEVIEAVKDGTLPEIIARGHQFVEQIEPNLPDMHVDYYRLLQVLINLVSNAYKYTPDGGTITLSARRIDSRVEFSVGDSGIGLAPKDVAMLGTKFWRAEDDYTRSQPGTGLGFAITRSLIEQMGSSVRIDSTVGEGSTFTFDVAITKPVAEDA